MKKIVVAASAFALAACGSNDAEVAETEIATDQSAEATEVDSTSPLVGSYGGESDDGEAWMSTLNADGTYQDVVAGEVTETGSWTHEDDQLCFNPDVEEGTESEQTCLTLVSINDDGSLLMSDAEGIEVTVPRLPE